MKVNTSCSFTEFFFLKFVPSSEFSSSDIFSRAMQRKAARRSIFMDVFI